MTDDYVVAIEGFEATRPLDSLPAEIITAAVRAVNRTSDRARTAAARKILEQVAFPPSYLNPGQGRLVVSKKASSDNLEAIVSARTRPTMLARFVTSGTVGKAGVSVQVAPGFAKFMKRAFLIRLPAGRGGDTETKGNLGLAIRLRPGETIHNKRVVRQIKGNLYLLYGVSVDQAFSSVREDIGPDTEDFLAKEFTRLMDLDL